LSVFLNILTNFSLYFHAADSILQIYSYKLDITFSEQERKKKETIFCSHHQTTTLQFITIQKKW